MLQSITVFQIGPTICCGNSRDTDKFFFLSYPEKKEFILLTACVELFLNELKKNYVQGTPLCTHNLKMSMDCLWSKEIMKKSI